MTVPKWLIPVLASVAAIAIALAGVLIGMRFATHEINATPAGTMTAPVLAPIATGDEELTDDASPAVGEQVVNVVGTSDENPVLRAVIDEVVAAADPAATLEVLGSEDPGAGASGDPCAPVDGDPPSDCPEGLHSTVLPLIGVRPVFVEAQAFPPTEAEYRASGAAYTLAPWCPAQAHSDSQAPLGIMSTVPAAFTITYWPSDEPSRVLTATASSESGRDAFEAGIAAGSDQYDMLQRTCILLPDLDPDTAYTASVQAIDIYDNVASPREVWFNSSGAPSRPGAEILTIGDNILIALHFTLPIKSSMLTPTSSETVSRPDARAVANGTQIARKRKPQSTPRTSLRTTLSPTTRNARQRYSSSPRGQPLLSACGGTRVVATCRRGSRRSRSTNRKWS